MKKLFLVMSTCIFIFMCYQDLFISHKNNSNEAQEISTFISSLNDQEKEYLANFFKVQFFIDSFGYTIFGEKPMSIDLIDINRETKSTEGFDYMSIEHIWDRHRVKEGWAVWKKYAHKFHQKNISIIEYPCHLSSNCTEIAIINHKNFIRVVNENLEDFRMVLGEEVSPSQVLNEYLRGDGTIFHKIRLHDGLFGTLLGYGRENAWEFNRLGRAGEAMVSFTPLKEFSPELEKSGTKNILPPLFSVIPESEETIKLRASYAKQRNKINSIYQSQDFLEKTLLELAQ